MSRLCKAKDTQSLTYYSLQLLNALPQAGRKSFWRVCQRSSLRFKVLTPHAVYSGLVSSPHSLQRIATGRQWFSGRKVPSLGRSHQLTLMWNYFLVDRFAISLCWLYFSFIPSLLCPRAFWLPSVQKHVLTSQPQLHVQFIGVPSKSALGLFLSRG